ncbi:MAG: voltage-dependent anion channel-domain-containing protein [Monoraphidium minutum]|nr:MAG: voltage-dependent anion channel-domain-containing protein [Monoraphidium minutum]
MGVMKSSKDTAEVPWLERRHVRMVREFTPSWFTACMGTGACALVWANTPYHFPGQLEIGMAVWCLNVTVFCFFSLLFLGRLLFFRDTIAPLMRHKSEPLFLGAIPMAFAVICNGFVAFFARYLHPEAALRAACALWYLNLPMTLGTSVALPFFIISRHKNTPESMTALWLLPIIPANVAAGSAGVLAAAHAAALGATDPALTSLVRSVILLGSTLLSYGLLMSLSITTLYWNRLMTHNLPPSTQLVSSFLPVGAISMCAFSAVNLGSAALIKFPGPDAQLLADFGAMLHGLGITMALVLWSYAVWWLVIAAASLVDNLRVLSFNLGWWGSVFPTGTMAVLTARLGVLLQIEGLKVGSVIIAAVHLALWVGVASMTARKAWKGELFYAPCLHEIKQQAAAAAAAAAEAGGTGAATGHAASRIRSELLCGDPGLSTLHGDGYLEGILGGTAAAAPPAGPRVQGSPTIGSGGGGGAGGDLGPGGEGGGALPGGPEDAA